MRTGATIFHYSTQVSQMTTSQSTTTTTKATFSPPAATIHHSSPWHSPVPYLFGGLAAMLGLIAFSLLILACSYWKLSDQVNGGEGDVERGGGGAEKGENNSDTKSLPFFGEKLLVIMAGEVKPTYLATPMMSSSKASNSFNDDEKVDSYKEEDTIKEKDETREQTGGGESK